MITFQRKIQKNKNKLWSESIEMSLYQNVGVSIYTQVASMLAPFAKIKSSTADKKKIKQNKINNISQMSHVLHHLFSLPKGI